MRNFLLTCLFLCAAMTAGAKIYTVETVPSPKAKGQEFYVSNPDTVLNYETELRINELCAQLDKVTEVELAVVAVDSFDILLHTTYDFALDLFNRWGVGKKDRNTGVLLFLGREAHDVQIITGSGIEGILTDAECGRILDDNLAYLSGGYYSEGIEHICEDISDKLMSDDNRAELLLGWKPADATESRGLTGALIIGFIIMAILAWKAYKKLNGTPGQTAKDIQNQSANLQSTSGCLAFLFPIPMVFFYIFMRIARKHAQTVPLLCPGCGQPMILESDKQADVKLSREQLKEEKMQAYSFRVWHCDACNTDEIIREKASLYDKYENCPKCGARTMEIVKKEVLSKATYIHAGEQMNYYLCKCCGHEMQKTIKLERLTPSYSTSSSGGGHRSGGHSGSFGGGHSSGGGAGRHF